MLGSTVGRWGPSRIMTKLVCVVRCAPFTSSIDLIVYLITADVAISVWKAHSGFFGKETSGCLAQGNLLRQQRVHIVYNPGADVVFVSIHGSVGSHPKPAVVSALMVLLEGFLDDGVVIAYTHTHNICLQSLT